MNSRPRQESQQHEREIQQGNGKYEKKTSRNVRKGNFNKSNKNHSIIIRDGGQDQGHITHRQSQK
jgi:hypothetical protein